MAATLIDTTILKPDSRDSHPGRYRIQPRAVFREIPKEWVEQSVVACFERQVQRTPQRLAVKFKSLAWTYLDLNRAANRLAEAIVAKCGKQQAPIAFLLGRSVWEEAAIVGILKAAKFYVPLDPAFPRARLQETIEDVGPRALVTDGQHIGLARELAGKSAPLINVDELEGDYSDDNLGLTIGPDDYAYVLYTSSSMGRAKGVLHRQRSLLHHLMKGINISCLDENDRVSVLASCGFAASVSGILGTLVTGAAVFPYDVPKDGVAGVAEWLEREEITIFQSVPTAFRGMVETLEGRAFPKLRIARLIGEPILKTDLELCRQYFGPQCVFATTLGTTEITMVRSLLLSHEMPCESSRVPVGYPVPDTEVLLLDDERQPVPPGEIGEIAVKSPYLAVGYWNQPELTEHVFLPDPTGGEERTYLTGDMGRMRPDGCLEHHGRKDFQVKVRGHRVDVEEIETTLLAMESLKNAVVVAREDRPGEQRLVAYVVPKGEAPSVSQMRQFLSMNLPSFMMPSAFVVLDSLPLTETGKVARLKLPAPTGKRPALRSSYRGPDDPLQLMLAELWEEMIDVRPIGIEDDFFELGGDSLLAVGLLTRIEESLGRAVPQAKFMERPTIDGLSRALIEEDAKRSQPMLVKLSKGGKGCPLIYVHGDFNGGGYYCYRLAQHFNRERPLWLLHPHGLFTPELPVTIEAMAADNVETLLAEWDGPFVLGGHCNGGLVALEMAQQLHARGSRVDAVIMIAPPKLEPPSSNGAGRLEPAKALAARRFEMGRVAQAARREFLVRAYGRIVNAYLPAPYAGKLTVLQPAESGPLPEVWQQIARDVEIRTIAGGHLTSITQHVAEFAAELSACIANGRN